MNDHQMREALKKAYPGKAWIEKVNKMSEPQVAAVYLRMKRENKI